MGPPSPKLKAVTNSSAAVTTHHPRSTSGGSIIAERESTRVRIMTEPRIKGSGSPDVATPSRSGDRITKSWEALLPRAEGISPMSEMMFSTLNPFNDSPSPRPISSSILSTNEIDHVTLQPSFTLGDRGVGGLGVNRCEDSSVRFPYSASWDSLAGASELSELATPPTSLLQLHEIIKTDDGHGSMGEFNDEYCDGLEEDGRLGFSPFGAQRLARSDVKGLGHAGRSQFGEQPRRVSAPTMLETFQDDTARETSEMNQDGQF